MNKQQKAVQKAALTAEEAELKALKAIYQQASSEVAEKIAIHQGTINTLLCNYDKLSEKEKSILQSKIYQKQFQESIQKQLDGFLEDLDSKQFESIYAYLDECYKNGYIGTMYDLAGQGIPIVTPIDQQDVAKAIHIDSQISTDLYTKLGEDVDLLKAKIKASISVGIATASPYSQMAKKIASDSNVGFNRAMRIARTEGHRVQISAAMDAQHNAKSKGADVLKQWSSALDARTRPTHRILDGQIRELDDYFEVNGKQTLAPGHFGIAGEDINCRCGILQKARWALDDDELEKMQKRAEYFGLDKTDEFEDFKKKYLGISSDNASPDSRKLYDKLVKQDKANRATLSTIKNANLVFRDKPNSIISPKQKFEDMLAVSNAFKNLPTKIKTSLPDVAFEFGHDANACDYLNKVIHVGVGSTEESINHEYGHLIENYMMNKADVDEYKKYLTKGLSSGNISVEVYHDNKGNEVPVYILKGERFETEYQGRLYVDKISDAINPDGSINIDFLDECVSEPFRKYMNKEPISDEAMKLIEGALK